MGQVLSLNPSKDLEDFVDFLFGAESGFVYLPTKDADTGRWDTYFFNWPRQKQDIVNHVMLHSKAREVYIGPAIYTEPKIDIGSIKGSQVVWAEFDGVIPTPDEFKGSPAPTLRIRSSMSGHEHWYWKLDKFSTDLKTVQDINRALAYALGADPSGWDLTQVLRPVQSVNHKRSGKAVQLLSNSRREHPTGAFSKLPPVEKHFALEDFDEKSVPKADRVIFKYTFPLSSDVALLTAKEIKQGSRSSALVRVAYMCCEKGMDNNEVYSLLHWCDSRWKKFYNRPSRQRYYVALIDYARQKFPYSSLVPEEEVDPEFVLPVLGMKSHVAQVDDTKWIVPGVLHNTSVVYFVGESESYKTMTAVEWAVNLSLGCDMLDWKIANSEKFKMLMLSLEMSGGEMNTRYNPILNRYPVEVQDILENNFLTYSDPNGLKLYDPVDIEKLRATIQKYKIQGIILDSAQMSMSENMSDEAFVKKSTSALQKIRHELGVFAIVIHHPRKDPAGSPTKKKWGLRDLFGSQVLQNSASTVIHLEKLKDKTAENPATIKLSYLKMRFNEEVRPADMTIELNTDLTFRRAVFGTLPASTGDENFTAMIDMANDMAKEKEKPDDGNGLTF